MRPLTYYLGVEEEEAEEGFEGEEGEEDDEVSIKRVGKRRTSCEALPSPDPPPMIVCASRLTLFETRPCPQSISTTR